MLPIKPLPPVAPDSGFGSGSHIWFADRWRGGSAHLGESSEAEPPRDAWAVLRQNQLWRQVLHEQTHRQAADALARNVAADQGEAVSIDSTPSGPSPVEEIPVDGLPCAVKRLADIELQLVMTFLPYLDVLHFARVCHQTVRAASAALPWRTYVVPIVVNDPPSHIRGLRQSGFLSYAPVSLRWRCNHPRDPFFEQMNVRYLTAALNQLTARPVLRLELGYPPTTALTSLSRFAQQILPHAALRPVRIIKLDRGGWRVGNAPVMSVLAAFPQLHSLNAAPDCATSFHGLHLLQAYDHKDFDPTSDASDAWAQLAAIPKLTALNLADSGKLASKSRLPHVFASSKLEKLGVVWPSLYGINWTLFFSAPTIQHLQSLSLDFFDADSKRARLTEAQRIPEGAFTTAWAGMVCLHTLTLRHIQGVDSLLPSIAAAPVLQSLVLFPGVRCAQLSPLKHDSVPTPEILASLINVAPNLFVTMIVLAPRRKCNVKIGPVMGYEASVRSLTLQRFRLDVLPDAKSV